jgi:hypothetical protein
MKELCIRVPSEAAGITRKKGPCEVESRWAQFWECLWLRVSHGIKINDFLFSKFRIQSKFETKFEEVSKYLNVLDLRNTKVNLSIRIQSKFDTKLREECVL